MRARVAFFGHDCTEITLIKRIRSFQRSGVEVLGFTYRRDKFNRAYVPEWPNVHLGTTVDRFYLLRLLKLLRALPILWRHRDRLRTADFFYARNIDNCALALLARALVRSRAPVVYEVLDVQRVFTGRGLLSRLFRLAERRILSWSQLLVVSSPAFMNRYFHPVQRYRGPWFLLENKIFGLDEDAARAHVEAPPIGSWVIGWLGNLRCPESLRLVCRIAGALEHEALIYVRGFPTETGLEPFLAAIAPHPNIVYEGEYRNPDDLPAIYGRVHFAWAFDFLDQGSNSLWLLPNRLYEGGHFGALALAARGTATGDKIEAHGLGWTFEPPYDEAITSFLATLDPQEYARRRQHLQSLPRSLFLDQGDVVALCRQVLGPARARRSDPQRATAAAPARRPGAPALPEQYRPRP